MACVAATGSGRVAEQHSASASVAGVCTKRRGWAGLTPLQVGLDLGGVAAKGALDLLVEVRVALVDVVDVLAGVEGAAAGEGLAAPAHPGGEKSRDGVHLRGLGRVWGGVGGPMPGRTEGRIHSSRVRQSVGAEVGPHAWRAASAATMRCWRSHQPARPGHPCIQSLAARPLTAR